MKKCIEIICLIGCGIFYLLVFSGMLITIGEMLRLFDLVLDIICGMISICSLVLAYKAIDRKIYNKINYLGIFIGVLTVALVIRNILAIFATTPAKTNVTLMLAQCTCNYTIVFGLIASLAMSIWFVDVTTSPKRMMMIALRTILCIVALLVIWLALFPFDYATRQWTGIRLLRYIRLGCILAVCIIGCWRRQKLEIKEEKILSYMINIQLAIGCLEVCGAEDKWTYIQIIKNLLHCCCYILIFNFMEQQMLGMTWRELELDVRGKQIKVIEGKVNKKMLMLAAKAIQNHILVISEAVTGIEQKIETEYKSQDISYVKKIENNCSRLFNLSHHVFQLAEIGKNNEMLTFKELNVVELTRDVIISMDPYMRESGIKLEYETSSDVIMGEVNQEGFERILINLLSNAVKYNKKNGQIWVKLSCRNDKIYLSVKDSGIGIPDYALDTAFQRFERIKDDNNEKQEGSGLGLSIVKSLVTLHQGEILIASKLEEGTVISINLPIKHEKKYNR